MLELIKKLQEAKGRARPWSELEEEVRLGLPAARTDNEVHTSTLIGLEMILVLADHDRELPYLPDNVIDTILEHELGHAIATQQAFGEIPVESTYAVSVLTDNDGYLIIDPMHIYKVQKELLPGETPEDRLAKHYAATMPVTTSQIEGDDYFDDHARRLMEKLK